MIKKIFLGLLLVVVVLIVGLVIYVETSWDKTYDVALPELQTSTDSAVIARGKYLVHGPAHCSNCHVSSVEEMIAADAGENIPLKGGVAFPFGPLGTLYAPNLTPDPKTGIGRYSDGQIFRMMRHGIRPSGMASIPLLMPFWNMADEDLIAVVSYLRSMPAVENEVPPAQWTFMGKVMKSFMPIFKPILDPNPPKIAPEMSPSIERGEYIARYVANCVGCHTERDLITFDAIGPEFAGGMEFEPDPNFNKAMGEDPELWIKTPNITPDPGSAFAQFKSLEEWKARFKKGRTIKISPMHWGPFSRMSEEDIEALFLYLNSLEPIPHDVGTLVYKK
ncbi:MAG: cytochrome c [Cyclobacteriaceae bacterium]|nr:cytochrome c [Cyclobacteriaceae bacterium]MDX5465334.1 cytochrome c [Cyclobacteriaceae bacterium]